MRIEPRKLEPTSIKPQFAFILFFVLSISSLSNVYAQLAQPDGEQIPQTNNLRDFLVNEGEPICPSDPEPCIDIRMDASLIPEVFIPNPNAPLTFKLVGEGAGYENKFGWYNVGDEYWDANDGVWRVAQADRHIILDCGNPSYDADPGDTEQVSFCGNPDWKGGAIGFLLITPEGTSNDCNRDMRRDDYDYIYYTEPRLNVLEQGDLEGAWIHHLTYQSMQELTTFYFGFEDLYRGGDNDFEDMLIEVTGLLTAWPSEICNGQDDDCDGEIDEDIAVDCSNLCGPGFRGCVDGELTACNAPEPEPEDNPATDCDGVDNDCDGLVDEDLVRACGNQFCPGVEVCVNGDWFFCTSRASSEEVCDGIDNDCDGDIDSEDADLVYEPLECVNSNDYGSCPGIRQCVGGVEGCIGEEPGPEICDGLDNDCDGQVDNGDFGPCDTSCGVDMGTIICNEGVPTCVGADPAPEQCNGQDDDCDGRYDEDPLAEPCVTQCGDAEVPGVRVCLEVDAPQASGSWSDCTALSQRDEICDGNDNDCDGLVDADDPDMEPLGTCDTACGEGTGSIICINGVTVCQGPEPTPEVCDGVDNDCDGLIDSDDPDMSPLGLCSTACESVPRVCVGGEPVCNAQVPTTELCNGLDDDCNGDVDDNLDYGIPEAQCATVCGPGLRFCNSETGSWEGCSAPEAQEEVCDGLDNDCDGQTDEGLDDQPLSRPCESVCGSGFETCTELGWAGCTAPLPGVEICDGEDNDCDRLVDNDDPDLQLGVCDSECGIGRGTERCVEGLIICIAPEPRDEICNGIDDDCDGEIDEGLERACDTVCGPGTAVCQMGEWVDCTAPAPVAEMCDGLDNDCDGEIDDDLAQPCWLSCSMGIETCVDGAWVDCTAPGPTEEVCDGLDNDCDNLVDEQEDATPLDRPCQTICGEGVEICIGGNWVNCDAQQPSDEICDGVDNDCDGDVDEEIERDCVSVCGIGYQTCDSGDWGECSIDVGEEICDGVDNDCDGIIDMLVEPCSTVCGDGEQVCQNGEWVLCSARLPSDEICDGEDNNCDGQIDEDVECEDPRQICHEGQCVTPCVGNECVGLDEICIDGFCISGPCSELVCEENEVCRDGECIDLACLDRECPPGSTCSAGFCVDIDCYVEGCPLRSVCFEGDCIDDPCLTVSCRDDQGCVLGECVESCAGVVCDDDQRCVEGQCRFDPCWDTSCGVDQICVEGQCFDDPCEAVACPDGRLCRNGLCEPDPCLTVTCPEGQGCVMGTCEGQAPPIEDGGIPPRDASVRPDWSGSDVPVVGAEAQSGSSGGGDDGCSCRQSADTRGMGFGIAWVGLMALLLFGFRRPLRSTLSKLLVLVSLISAGCDSESGPAEPAGDVAAGDARVADGATSDSGAHPIPDSGSGSDAVIVPGCTPTNDGIEICDYIDNDCDGFVDENYHLESDPYHCGSCEIQCSYENASGVCTDSVCSMGACFPGWSDQDDDPSNGCEVQCQATLGGIEVCDHQDNDCNGVIDDGYDLMSDVNNCGECGARCNLPNVVEMACVGGECQVVECLDGWSDVDGSPLTGCEADCVPTGDEVCDYIDNDCDGVIDDGFFVAIDPLNCGECGVECVYENAESFCVEGECVMGPCLFGWSDSNQDEEDGCEAECVLTNNGIERCDEIDNNCNGVIDEGFSLERDLYNCGVCGNTCAFPNAIAVCVDAQCDLQECMPGFVNTDQSIENGCEASCQATNGGVEACDGIDNDCDGEIDEDFNLLEDPNHCGSCNFACAIPNGTPGCEEGFCTVSSCEDGYSDLNRQVADGCETLCERSNGGVEICDYIDNDCDGLIDNGFELDSDPLHCDECNHNCEIEIGENAQAACLARRCVIGDCNPGWVDLDRQVENGCEYECEITNENIEICDEIDNNCDGVVDNGIDKLNDPENCGECGVICAAPNAQVWCSNGVCSIFQCLPGFRNLSGEYEDGCEYECTTTNGGVEICDNLDNNCDGRVDEGFEFDSNINHCGGCNQQCTFAHANSHCEDGACVFDGCHDGFIDIDQDTSNGCEYPCQLTGDPAEICDGIDNDCNGVVDDGFNFEIDSTNCGTCGVVCAYENASSHCENFRCVFDGCDEGYLNSNLDLRDGCECIPSGDEICDGLDNDCDGLIDEDFLSNDPSNCGSCGNNCTENDGAHHTTSYCGGGECVHVCLPGWGDPNGDGDCECSVSPEVCDGIDNDCDGLIDGADSSLEPPPPYCVGLGVCGDSEPVCNGAEGWDCGFPETWEDDEQTCDGLDNDCNGLIDDGLSAAGDCAREGVCVNTIASCNGQGGWVCNYPVTYEAEEQKCDYLDNDCDGEVDEDFPRRDQVCTVGLGVCARVGLYVCSEDGAQTVCSATPDMDQRSVEICDGLDNDCDGEIDEDVDRATEMIHVVAAGYDFWIDKWEASRADASDESAGQNNTRACSRANVRPWVDLTYEEAAAACAARDKRMCTDAEWGLACAYVDEGTRSVYPYGDAYEAMTCNQEDNHAGVLPTGDLGECVSALGVNDMAGNVAEWTDCERSRDCRVTYGVFGGHWEDSQELFYRCAFRSNAAPTTKNKHIGFRCCQDPD